MYLPQLQEGVNSVGGSIVANVPNFTGSRRVNNINEAA